MHSLFPSFLLLPPSLNHVLLTCLPQSHHPRGKTTRKTWPMNAFNHCTRKHQPALQCAAPMSGSFNRSFAPSCPISVGHSSSQPKRPRPHYLAISIMPHCHRYRRSLARSSPFSNSIVCRVVLDEVEERALLIVWACQ